MKERRSLNEEYASKGLGQYRPMDNDIVWAAPLTTTTGGTSLGVGGWPHRKVTTYCASNLT